MRRGQLFILSAPSGTGKSTLIHELLHFHLAESGGVAFAVSHTTRAPRAGEVEGEDYHFVDHAAFQEMIAADLFLEWAYVHDNYYGTAFGEVSPRLERGLDVLLDIDVQGADLVVNRWPEAVTIFVLPPSFTELERRLRGRNLDDSQAVARRLEMSRQEIERYDRYQYVIINDDVRRASQALAAIILERRHRLERMTERIHRVLEEFGSLPPSREPPG